MNKEQTETAKLYFQAIEDNLSQLPVEEQAKVYRPCAINCVKGAVLQELRRQFEECQCNLDLQYTKYARSEYFFVDIIKKGHIYEMGYPRCFCPLVESGFVKSPVHCECSRQSILYVLQELVPDKKIEVETLGTVLSGAGRCCFRVIVE